MADFGSWSNDWGFNWGGGTQSTSSLASNKRVISAFYDFIRKYKTKSILHFSYREYGEDYDPYENNYSKKYINPLPVKCYARELSPESLIFRRYGLVRTGALDLLIENKYFNHFLYCSKIIINSNEYEVYRNAVGQYGSIRTGPLNLSAVVVERKSGTNIVLPQYSKDVSLELKKQIKHLGKRVLVYPAYKRPNESYDPEENVKEINFLNPIPIDAYVSNTKGLTNVLKEYGLQSQDAKQLVTFKNHKTLLRNSYKIKIDGREYQVFRDNVGQNAVMQSEPSGLVRTIIESF